MILAVLMDMQDTPLELPDQLRGAQGIQATLLLLFRLRPVASPDPSLGIHSSLSRVTGVRKVTRGTSWGTTEQGWPPGAQNLSGRRIPIIEYDMPELTVP